MTARCVVNCDLSRSAHGLGKSYGAAPGTSSGVERDGRNISVEQALYEPWRCRSVDVFKKIEQIGEGTYGQVYMARDKDTGETVVSTSLELSKTIRW